MSILSNFAIGFLGAIIGVIPPGLLNITAAKISMKQGRKVALLYATGVCITVCLQTYIALIFARYLDRHPEIIDTLRKVALGIFISLSLYFFLGQGYPTGSAQGNQLFHNQSVFLWNLSGGHQFAPFTVLGLH